MSTDAKLEAYLQQLDKMLGQVSTSDRADIITEIKSHVLEAKEREPKKSIESILNALGEPETTANKYLLERGLKPNKPAKTPMVKWLTIGFLGTTGMILTFMLLIIWKFSPIVKVDETSGRVQILGGLIDVSSESMSEAGGLKSFNIDLGEVRKLSGEQTVTGKIEQLNINFANGKFEFTQNTVQSITWNCKAQSSDTNVRPIKTDNGFDLSFGNAKCEIGIPSNVHLTIKGSNGKIEFDELSSPIQLNLSNGAVSFKPRTGTEYKFDIKVQNGAIDTFSSSELANAIPVMIHMTNGKVEYDH